MLVQFFQPVSRPKLSLLQICASGITYLICELLAVLILTCLAGADGLRSIFAAESRLAVCCFFVGSLFNGAGQAISMMNLSRGGRALAYAIPQQGFLLPD